MFKVHLNFTYFNTHVNVITLLNVTCIVRPFVVSTDHKPVAGFAGDGTALPAALRLLQGLHSIQS